VKEPAVTIEHYRLLFSHNAWATGRVLDQVEAIGIEVTKQPAGLDLGDGSIWETLVHMLGAEERWFARCQGDASRSIAASDAAAATMEAVRARFDNSFLAPLLDASGAATIDAVRARFDAQAAAWQEFLDRLTDADLDGIVTNTSKTSGKVFSHPLWSRLSHVLSHSTQHRAELALATSRLGYSPGEIDFLEYYEFFR
jgi:uncharacterized damage-inducible protein DinB